MKPRFGLEQEGNAAVAAIKSDFRIKAILESTQNEPVSENAHTSFSAQHTLQTSNNVQ